MFKNSIRLPFKLFGIPIYLDVTFLIVLPILGWMIGNNVPAMVETLGLGIETPWLEANAFVVGLVAAIGLFGSVLVHEIGHCLVARRYGVEATRITLWLLGGMAQFAEIPRRKGVEAVIAIAGPLTSFAVAGLLALALRYFGDFHVGIVFVLSYLVVANAVLAIFNLVPAFPLDGGRVLRSLLAFRLPFAQATAVAAELGKMMAFLLGFLGLLTFNLFLILIAFFVYAAGRNESTAVAVQDALGELTVGDIMTRRVETVPAHLPIPDLLDRMLVERHQGYPVVDLSGEVVGMISLDGIKASGVQTGGAHLRVSDVMRSPAPSLSPGDRSVSAFERLNREQTDRFVVTDDDGRMVGIVSRTDLLRAIQIKLLGVTESGDRPDSSA